jgi:bisphosphoglycerate-independent phosphoglycerate mutase (AlkP superfamily)
LRAEQAIYQEFTNRALIDRGFEVPFFSPTQAGRILGRRSLDFDLVLFEYFRTDAAGHSQNMEKAEEEIRRLEEFLQALLGSVDLEQTLVILSSDHGNIEDLSVRGHTLNRALTLLWGIGAKASAIRMESITDVTHEILRVLVANRSQSTK